MDDEAWFAPKRYGYGAGMPIAWQGWALLGAYALIVSFACGFVIWDEEVGMIAFAALVVPATAALVYIAALKTRGGWHWRWGSGD